ncbi:hypothetical protein ACIOD2_00085 [Amycolatopsis sp. NPDC088138]|uniref:hypothetical protein n=1 Tax=Amycolatopsis sp. NPDC088138 TaxID=3363938 RepID=UPI00380F3303
MHDIGSGNIDVSRTGSADAAHGGYANSGVHIGDVCLHTGLPVRTRYREQVRRIAPPSLLGRDRELLELTEFCTTTTTGPRYAWWRAKAWTGKSALMSWFVLNPPPGVRIVSFFVTARLAGQSDRRAFIDNVFEQLATILDEPVPPYMTEYTREAHLLGMLREAAALCRERAEQFVLLVDGLDEDRGVTTGPDAHSIAALLPPDPPEAMKVIVAGRPNPPVPSDVLPDHPLFDTSIVHDLAESAQARVIRGDMQRELKRLLTGDQTQRDLLGLVTAAVGGVSSADLAELTGEERWVIDDHLHTVAGRTFRTRTGRWRGSTETYILGHEELQSSARTFLGRTALDQYVERLHAWADGYRESGWPPDTPEYLLSGYFRLLVSSGDIDRVIGCITDSARHDRMLALSGSDSAALEEIREVQDLVLGQEPLDVAAMARLAVHREHLVDRNTWIPVQAPAVWEYLGFFDRADALAGSMPPDNRPAAYAKIAIASAELGNLDRAMTVIRALGDGQIPEDDAVTLSLTLAERGFVAEAGEVMPSSSRPDVRTVRIALLYGARGDFRRALVAAETVADHEMRFLVLCDLATGALRGDQRPAGLHLVQVAESTLAVFEPWPAGLAQLVKAMALSGDLDHAIELANELDGFDEAQGHFDYLTRQDPPAEYFDYLTEPLSPAARVEMLLALLDAAQAAGRADYAERVHQRLDFLIGQEPADSSDIHTVTASALAFESLLSGDASAALETLTGNPIQDPPDTLASMAYVCARNGRLEPAVDLVLRAEVAARTQRDHGWRDRDLEPLANALASSGHVERAQALTGNLPEPRRLHAVDAVAQAAAMRGYIDEAYRVTLALPDANSASRAMVCRALLRSGRHQAAWTLIDAMTDPLIVLSLVPAAPAEDRPALLSRARRCSEQESTPQHWASALAASGDFSSATAKAQEVSDPVERDWTWSAIAIHHYQAGDCEGASRLLDFVEAPFRRGWTQNRLSNLAAASGDLAEAGALADSISDPYLRVRAMVELVELNGLQARYWADRAEHALADVDQPPLADRQRGALAGALASAGEFARAKATVETVGDRLARVRALAQLASHSGLDIADHTGLLLRTCPWTALLPTLRRKHPEALVAIADELSPL